MRKVQVIGLALLVGLSGAGLAKAHQAANQPGSAAVRARSVALTGEIIDPQCYFMHDARGTAHVACATRCAHGGQGLAFLDERTGRVYPVIAGNHGENPNDKILPQVGKRVIVRGVVFSKGQDSVLQVQSVVLAKTQ